MNLITLAELAAEKPRDVYPVAALRDASGRVRLPCMSQEFRPRDSAEGAHLGNDIMFRALDGEPKTGPRRAGPFYVPPGAMVVACTAGKVNRAYLAPNGWRVWIDHPSGYYSLYLHLAAAPLVREGDDVMIGQVLGEMGGDPTAADPNHTVHLHFEVRRQNDHEPVDPAQFLEKWPALLLEQGAAVA